MLLIHLDSWLDDLSSAAGAGTAATPFTSGNPKLKIWFDAMSADAQGARVRAEVEGALQGWESGGRWDNLGISEQVVPSVPHLEPPTNLLGTVGSPSCALSVSAHCPSELSSTRFP